MNDPVIFESWSMTIKKSQQVIIARKKISGAVEEIGLPNVEKALISTAVSDISRIILKHYSSFDLYVKPEIQPSQKGLSIKIQLPEVLSNGAEDVSSQDLELLDILKNEIKTKSVIFDELILTPENGIAPTFTLIKWNYSQPG